MFEHVLGCVQVVNSASSPGCQAGRWGTVVERLAGRMAPSEGESIFTAKTSTVKRAPEEKRQRKKRQPENWATEKIGNEK